MAKECYNVPSFLVGAGIGGLAAYILTSRCKENCKENFEILGYKFDIQQKLFTYKVKYNGGLSLPYTGLDSNIFDFSGNKNSVKVPVPLIGTIFEIEHDLTLFKTDALVISELTGLPVGSEIKAEAIPYFMFIDNINKNIERVAQLKCPKMLDKYK